MSELVPIPEDPTLASDVNLYKLVPTSEEYFATAAYVICLFRLHSDHAALQKILVKLWSLNSEEDFSTFRTYFNAQKPVVKFIFCVCSRTGRMCIVCWKLTYDFIDGTKHSCTNDRVYPAS